MDYFLIGFGCGAMAVAACWMLSNYVLEKLEWLKWPDKHV
jgi:hypothetical protein